MKPPTSRIKGPQYLAWKAAVLKRDGYKCLKCGSHWKARLQVHHIKTWARAPELRYVVSNGITFCYPCHKSIWQAEESYEQLCYMLLAKNNMILKIGRVRYPRITVEDLDDEIK